MMLINPLDYPMLMSAPAVMGLDADSQSTLNELVAIWSWKYPRNAIRKQYMDAKAVVKNLGIALSDEIAESLKVVCGWPEKAVYGLSQMCMWDGVVSPGGDDDQFDLEPVLHANRFDVELPMTIAAELEHSCAFLTVTNGDDGVPLVMPFSAMWATAKWDRRHRELEAGLTITDADDLGRPTAMTLFTRAETVEIRDAGSGWFVERQFPNKLPRVPMEVLSYRATLDRPFGRSRISRPVMSITDRAIRTTLRMDIASELFTSPGMLANGITEEQFEQIKKWTWRMSSVKGLTRDEDDNLAEVTSLPQQSMQPYVEQIRELATEFAGITSLPLNSLGVVQDNPSSADAMYAAKEELVIEATNLNRANGYALNRIYQDIVMLRDGKTEVSDELAQVSTRWRNPAMPSIVSQSDAMVKQISAIPDLAKTDVALEEMGYTDEQIKRIRGQIRRSQARDQIAALAGQPAQPMVQGRIQPVSGAVPAAPMMPGHGAGAPQGA